MRGVLPTASRALSRIWRVADIVMVVVWWWWLCSENRNDAGLRTDLGCMLAALDDLAVHRLGSLRKIQDMSAILNHDNFRGLEGRAQRFFTNILKFGNP